MKRHEPKSVGQIIQETISRCGNPVQYERQQISYLWQEVVGPEINRLTIRRFVDADALHVYMASAPLKQELSFRSQALVDALNQLVGKNVINKIIFH